MSEMFTNVDKQIKNLLARDDEILNLFLKWFVKPGDNMASKLKAFKGWWKNSLAAFSKIFKGIIPPKMRREMKRREEN